MMIDYRTSVESMATEGQKECTRRGDSSDTLPPFHSLKKGIRKTHSNQLPRGISYRLALFLSTEKGFNTASMPVSASFDRKEACQNQDSLRSSVVLKVSSSSNFGKRKLKFTSFLNCK
jgi:hypothetical protein